MFFFSLSRKKKKKKTSWGRHINSGKAWAALNQKTCIVPSALVWEPFQYVMKESCRLGMFAGPLIATFSVKPFFFSPFPPLFNDKKPEFAVQMKQALRESDSLWTTLHIPSHHYIRQHNPISGWWAAKVGSLPGRRFHGSQPPKVMRFSANSMKSGLNFGSKLDNSCLRSISRMVYGNALHIWQSIMWPYGWDFVMVPTETWKAALVLTFFLISYMAQKMVDLNTWL